MGNTQEVRKLSGRFQRSFSFLKKRSKISYDEMSLDAPVRNKTFPNMEMWYDLAFSDSARIQTLSARNREKYVSLLAQR